MRGWSTWLISAAGTYKPRFVVYEIYKPRPNQSDYSIPRSCALTVSIVEVYGLRKTRLSNRNKLPFSGICMRLN